MAGTQISGVASAITCPQQPGQLSAATTSPRSCITDTSLGGRGAAWESECSPLPRTRPPQGAGLRAGRGEGGRFPQEGAGAGRGTPPPAAPRASPWQVPGRLLPSQTPLQASLPPSLPRSPPVCLGHLVIHKHFHACARLTLRGARLQPGPGPVPPTARRPAALGRRKARVIRTGGAARGGRRGLAGAPRVALGAFPSQGTGRSWLLGAQGVGCRARAGCGGGSDPQQWALRRPKRGQTPDDRMSGAAGGVRCHSRRPERPFRPARPTAPQGGRHSRGFAPGARALLGGRERRALGAWGAAGSAETELPVSGALALTPPGLQQPAGGPGGHALQAKSCTRAQPVALALDANRALEAAVPPAPSQGRFLLRSLNSKLKCLQSAWFYCPGGRARVPSRSRAPAGARGALPEGATPW